MSLLCAPFSSFFLSFSYFRIFGYQSIALLLEIGQMIIWPILGFRTAWHSLSHLSSMHLNFMQATHPEIQNRKMSILESCIDSHALFQFQNMLMVSKLQMLAQFLRVLRGSTAELWCFCLKGKFLSEIGQKIIWPIVDSALLTPYFFGIFELSLLINASSIIYPLCPLSSHVF